MRHIFHRSAGAGLVEYTPLLVFVAAVVYCLVTGAYVPLAALVAAAAGLVIYLRRSG